jgi:aldose 1-epimerase
VFRHTSPHLEEGYPGALDVTVTYSMTARDELRIDYEARTDRTTPVNLTNHTYWNLADAGRGSILGHELELAAARYTPTDAELIPTGEIASVEGTALDFRSPRTIGSQIDEVAPGGGGGYDHNLVLSERGSEPTFAARLRDPASGRVVEIWTTQPCLQLYSGGFITPTKGKLGRQYDLGTGLCLEAQDYPDAVNNPGFDSVLLAPGEVYRATTIIRVTTDAAPLHAAGMPRS